MTLQPLADTEFDRLGEILKLFGSSRSMTVEGLDGFFAALICGPDNVLPSEYLPEIWGDGIVGEGPLSIQAIYEEFISLIMRHWNSICDCLRSGDVFTPLLLEDEAGVAHANDWANGFVRGMALRREEWGPFVDEDQVGGALIPVFALAHEHNPDPEMRPYKEPIDAELREKLIIGAAAGVIRIYRHFEPQRLLATQLPTATDTFRRTTPKVGRNDPCPCGSGKKFKYCCANLTWH